MNETVKNILFKFVLPALGPVLIGLGSAVISSKIMTETLNERVAHLERSVNDEKLLQRTANIEVQIERHERALERDFARHEHTVDLLSTKTEEQERRLTRLEALVDETQRLLAEIRADVKTLLRGSTK